ncbi:proline racemase family protein [Virgibacillus oceani]
MIIEKMFSTIDTHVEGEAFRIVIQSPINLNQNDFESNQQLLQMSYHGEKEFLLNEPRGHRGMNGCVVIPSKAADFGLLFFNHDPEIHFNYGGLAASVTALLETGNLKVNENGVYKIETIQGIYVVKANLENQEVTGVYLESKACRITDKKNEYHVVEIDGNRSYIILPLPESIPGIDINHLSSINKWGKKITERFHNENMAFNGVIITDEITNTDANAIRSVTFEKDGNITRSPGIDSTFAILTGLRETLNEYTYLINNSIFNSSITASLLLGTEDKFFVEVQGFTTGIHQFIYDKDDPLKNGFLLK